MLDLQTGRYYGLNQTAGRMLEALERGTDLDVAVADLAAEFETPEETVRQDFLELCDDLAARGLIEIEPESAAEAA
jgi:predicted DNA-binding transcriptional regulator YafY